ncbi:MAG: hypothetical protein II295_06100 [Akkermansia sp.]|nr:hypothetical protein [Akkermansia sp.]
MIKNSTAAAVLAVAAFSAPMVCQAQDPATAARQVQSLLDAGKVNDAIAVCDKMIATYGNSKSRLAAQFAHYEPFFHWRKGNILFAAKQYAAAYEAFKTINTDARFQNKKLRDRALAEKSMNDGNGYEPYLTASLFYMGYSKFQEAVGDPKAKPAIPGNPAKFAEAIPDMENYLKLYQSGKISKMEKEQKMDGKLCFMLLQAYLLKPEPDFKKAGEYLEKSRTAKAALPDDMAMSGLATILKVAGENPEHIGWVYKVIRSNPHSFNLGPVRLARYGSQFFNPALTSAKQVSENLKKGNMTQADEATKTTYELLGLVPEIEETRRALHGMYSTLKGYKGAVPDPATGASYRASDCAALFKNYDKLGKAKTQMEAYALIAAANVAQQYGSNRLAKAGYQILMDRYPGLMQNSKDGAKSMKDKNTFQLAQLCRATGDEETAVALESKVDTKEMGEGGQVALLINKMARLTKEENWEEASSVAAEVIKATQDSKQGAHYAPARFVQVAAAWKLKKWEDVITLGEAALSEDIFAEAAKGGKYKEATAVANETQTRYFIIDAHSNLARKDVSHWDKLLTCVEAYIAKFPKEETLLPNVYFQGIDTLLKRQGGGKPEAMAKDMEKALAYCSTFAEKFPQNTLYPHVRMLTGNILINGEDEARKPEGIVALQDAVEAGLKTDKGKSVAANALYMLSSYGREIALEGEDDAAQAKRAQGYVKRFWAEADFEGCEYSLKMVNITLNDAAEVDKATFEAAVKQAQTIIAREANYGLANNSINTDMESTINGYASTYVDGYKKFNKADLSLEEQVKHFSEFPGIVKEDKYTNAILRMAMLTSMSQAQAKLAKDKDKDGAARMEQEIGKEFRRMTNEFKPSDLTQFICVQVGNYEVDYARRLNDANMRNEEATTALSYFEEAISRGGEYTEQAKLGKASALGLTNDDSKKKESAQMFETLAASQDQEIAGPALFGITKLHMATGNYAEAVKSAKRFEDAGIRTGRKDMQLLYGEALAKNKDYDNALVAYTNLYQDMGNIAYSAPACKALMEIYWERNTPATGDRLAGTFKPSDHWRAWNTAQVYVKRIRESKLETKMTPDDRDKYNEVVTLLNQYAADAGVQREDKENKAFQAQIGNRKKK